MLKSFLSENEIEAGCDEAGRGCIAGPVCAAAVILSKDFYHPFLNDSKVLSEKKRYELRPIIESNAISFGVAFLDAEEIDKMNILKASLTAMHHSLDQLSVTPTHVLIDGNRFIPYKKIKHTCIVKGDSLFASIAAASILAKTYRDDFMNEIHNQFPMYHWNQNKGYPTALHRSAVLKHGLSIYHRKTFACFPKLNT
ncbi:MAG TPA: ribonuclease HII [Chitinophagaceae bacterium]|nr:ribonuclease HII [Chitinophagaceae bacterium]